MSRWSTEQQHAIDEMRYRLKVEMEPYVRYPEIVGDRKLIRFYHGSERNVDKAINLYSNFLKWRKANNVDNIRNKILYEGLNHPYKFPFGKTIVQYAPQIVLAPFATDFEGRPITLEMFGFDPYEALNHITIEQYKLFLIHCLEYRGLILEQLSEMKEREYLKTHKLSERKQGYGVLIKTCIIRDFKGIGFIHLGSHGKAVFSAATSIALPNYLDYMGQSYMINVPWLFQTFWFFIRQFLNTTILAKIHFLGEDYMGELLQHMPLSSIPECIGGSLKEYNEAFEFDLSIFDINYNNKLSHKSQDILKNKLNQKLKINWTTDLGFSNNKLKNQKDECRDVEDEDDDVCGWEPEMRDTTFLEQLYSRGLVIIYLVVFYIITTTTTTI